MDLGGKVVEVMIIMPRSRWRVVAEYSVVMNRYVDINKLIKVWVREFLI